MNTTDDKSKPDMQLVEVLKLAYRKHVASDDGIGWDELSDALRDALCNALGDDWFYEWLKGGCK